MHKYNVHVVNPEGVTVVEAAGVHSDPYYVHFVSVHGECVAAFPHQRVVLVQRQDQVAEGK